jgi:hypothetical protein
MSRFVSRTLGSAASSRGQSFDGTEPALRSLDPRTLHRLGLALNRVIMVQDLACRPDAKRDDIAALTEAARRLETCDESRVVAGELRRLSEELLSPDGATAARDEVRALQRTVAPLVDELFAIAVDDL